MNLPLSDELAEIREARIFFGHQSVGANLIVGIDEICDQFKLPGINFIKPDATGNQDKGFFAYTKIGENNNPQSKCHEFERLLRNELSGSVDIAILKLCYADIDRETNVDEVFRFYKEIIDGLAEDFPSKQILAATLPLRQNHQGMSIFLRELAGRPNKSKLDNFRRNEFNRRLYEYYPPGRLLDFATWESTKADSKREFYTMNGQKCFSLFEGYTDDGGHLNKSGRRAIAVEFIRKLADIVVNQKKATTG